jgi:hypothetical protein
MVLSECGGGLVEDVAAYGCGVGMGTPDPLLGADPAVRRLLPSLGGRIETATPAGGSPLQRPQPMLGGGQRFRGRDPIDLTPVRGGHNQQTVSFHPDINTHHRGLSADMPGRVHRALHEDLK